MLVINMGVVPISTVHALRREHGIIKNYHSAGGSGYSRLERLICFEDSLALHSLHMFW